MAESVVQGLVAKAMCEECVDRRKDIAIYHVFGRKAGDSIQIFTPVATCSFCGVSTVCVLVASSVVSVN